MDQLTKQEIEQRIKDINYYLLKYKYDIMENWTDDWRLSHMTPEQNKEWLKGVIFGITTSCHQMMEQLMIGMTYGDLEDAFLVKANRRLKERYGYHEDWIANKISVAINRLYGHEIEEGKTYHSHIKPWALLKINNKMYPIFSDDSGQQDYIRFEDGDRQGFGPYNFDTVGTAIYYWIRHIKDIGIKRIEDYQA